MSRKEIGYKVVKINTTKFSFKEIEYQLVDEIFNNKDILAIELEVGLGIEKDKSQIFLEINTTLTDKKTDDILVAHTGKTTYSIQGLDSTYKTGGESFDLPDELVIQLYSLAYSHARALLSVELNSTVFKDKFYLPVIDPSNIIKR